MRMPNVAARTSLAVLSAALFLLAACSDAGGGDPSPPTGTANATASPVATATQIPASPVSTAAATALPVPSPTPQSPPRPILAAIPPVAHWTGPMDRIVYQAADGAIYTVKPDGSDRRRVSGGLGSEAEATNVWPGWSPDSGSVVFSALSSVNGRASEAS